MQENVINTYYRISDKGKRDGKPDYINWKNCLLNYLSVFGKENFHLIADNVEWSTFVELLKIIDADHITRTTLGNSKSFIYTVNQCLEKHKSKDDIIYLVEDDYLHVRDAPKILIEGLKIADYVTLYDHPDKYDRPSKNPLVEYGGEVCRVLKTASSYWKETNSTCMTFATTVKFLKLDKTNMEHFCRGNKPRDFAMWRNLITKYKRTLISPLPGYATHGMTRRLSPFRNWEEIGNCL